MKKTSTTPPHEKLIIILIGGLAVAIGYFIEQQWRIEDKNEELAVLEDFKANSIETISKYVEGYDSTEYVYNGKTYKYIPVDYQFTVDGKTYSNFKTFDLDDTIPAELPIFYHEKSPKMNSFDIEADIRRVEYKYDSYSYNKKSAGRGYLIGLVVIFLFYANYRMIKKYFFEAKR